MTGIHEDIFSNDAIELVLRFADTTILAFDKANNKYPFENIKNLVNNKEINCCLLKQNDLEHKIIIPLLDLQEQFEVVAKWHISSTYEGTVNRNKKTRLKTSIEIPEKKYRIDQKCVIRVLGLDEIYENFESLRELNDIKKRVDKLEIVPKTLIENQRETWTKYIEAQELLIKKLQEPFYCTGKHAISEVKNNKGETVKYKLKIDLVSEKNDEYKIFEDELKTLDANEKFNLDGTIFLKIDDIFRGLDAIIKRKFSDVFERERNIGCILKIKPLSIVKKIQQEVPTAVISITNEYRQIWVSDYKGNVAELNTIISKYGLVLSKVAVDFGILNIENLYDSPLNKSFNLTFGNKYKRNEHEKEVQLPEPLNKNTFRIIKPIINLTNDEEDASVLQGETLRIIKHKGTIDDIQFFKQSLYGIYGKTNVKVTNISYIYEPLDKETTKFFEQVFTNEFWTDIKRDLYLIGFDVFYSESDQTLYFEFRNRDDLIEKYSALKNLHKFDFLKSPLDDDFRFKVKTNLIAKKSNKQIFQEKLEKLKGVEFVTDKAKSNSKRNDFVFIGKLSTNESSLNQLVFNIPYRFSDEKKLAKEFFKYLETKPEFKFIQANLKGDEAKTKWLREAMDKLKEKNQASEKINSKPINLKIRDFIFDSAKAEPIYRFDTVVIEETEEYKNIKRNEILNINEAQRKSILSALYATDMCLLQGPPGTGKTTVIAELIWQHIRLNQTTKLLLTSETNLAVDNALEKLMNIKNINPLLANFITTIKPIRFGKSSKFEEEGKKYSMERIQKWLDEDYFKEVEYEQEQLTEETDEEEEGISDNPSNNVIQQWMIRIADRSRAGDTKYSTILKDWVTELSMPSKETKNYFKEKYFKYINVIGSTCSSAGSPAFKSDYLMVCTQNIFQNYVHENKYHESLNELQLKFDQCAAEEDFTKIEGLCRKLKIPITRFAELIKKPTISFIQSLFINELNEIIHLYENEHTGRRFNNLLNRYEFKDAEDVKSLFNIRFDTVIMDEASKATPPDLLLPLCFGKKSIIIGDHRQLPPLLNEKDFKETLLDLNDATATKLAEEIDREFVETSQFKRLILNQQVSPTIKSTFNIQYRMHPQINDVIKQFYLNDESGGLFCGLDINKVNDPDLNEPESRYHGFFLDGFINADIHTIWIDVDEPEMQDGTSRVNETEVEAVKKVLECLHRAEGFDEYMNHWNKIKNEEKRLQEKEIGIISFYGKQVSRLRDVRKTAKQLGIPIRLKTVDKFQGMERNIIIVSTVRSDKLNNGNDKIGPNSDIGFAKAPERLNVALSRARRLLIVVGNKRFFYKFKDKEGNRIYKNAIDQIAKNGRIIDYKTLDK